MTDEQAANADVQSGSVASGRVVSGRVTGPEGNPVPGVTVQLYPFDAGADAEPLETETDSEGAFEFEALADADTRAEYVSEPDESVLLARYNDWFWSASGDFQPESASTLEISLRNQLLFGPEIARSGSGRWHELSLLTCWRQIDGPGLQTLFLEATNVRGAVDRDRFEVLDDPNDLRAGTFSVTVPRGAVRVNFGPHTDVGDEDSLPAQVLALATGRENPELANWHPTRTGLPIFGIGSGYVGVSSTDPKTADGPETVVEGVGRIVRGLPGIATVLSLADAAEFAIGERLQREASLGDADVGFPDPTNPDDLQRVPDPNTHTSALLGWQSTDEAFSNTAAGSVVMIVPMELQTDNTPRATAHAEWLHPTARATFGEGFELSRPTLDRDAAVGATETDEGDGKSTGTSEDDEPTVEDYAGDDGTVDTAGLLEAADDFRNREISTDTMIDVAISFRPDLPFG